MIDSHEHQHHQDFNIRFFVPCCESVTAIADTLAAREIVSRRADVLLRQEATPAGTNQTLLRCIIRIRCLLPKSPVPGEHRSKLLMQDTSMVRSRSIPLDTVGTLTNSQEYAGQVRSRAHMETPHPPAYHPMNSCSFLTILSVMGLLISGPQPAHLQACC